MSSSLCKIVVFLVLILSFSSAVICDALDDVIGAADGAVGVEEDEPLMAFAIAPLTKGDLLNDCKGKLELELANRIVTLGAKEHYPNLIKR